MSWQSDEEVLLRNYLLGVLDEARREQVEERLFYEDGFAEKLSAAQDALIDDYVFDALPAGERESFGKNFVFDDERRGKLLFAQTLEVYVDERCGAPTALDDQQLPAAWWRDALQFLRAHKTAAVVSAFAILLLLLTPALVRWLRPPDRNIIFAARRADIERRMAELNKRPADPNITALPSTELALQPTILRDDSGIKRAPLAEGVKLLTLKLSLPLARQDNYRALVLTVEGDELFAVDGLTPEADAATILLRIPTEFLATGDYQIQLRGAAAGLDGSPVRYSFRVIDPK
jgi:hypothetical protein